MSLTRITADDMISAIISEIEGLSPRVGDLRTKFKHQILLTQDDYVDRHKNREFVLEEQNRTVSPVCFGARRSEIQLYIAYQNKMLYDDFDLIRYHLLTKVWTNGIISVEIDGYSNLKIGEGSTAFILAGFLNVDYMPADMG